MTAGKRRRTSFALVLLALGVAGGFLLARYMPTAGESPRRVLLDLRRPVDSMGALFAFTIAEPGVVRVHVGLERCCEDTEARAAFGPLLPALRPHAVYEPDPALDTAFTVTPSAAPGRRFDLKKPGVYAVRIEPIPSAMGSEDEAIAAVKVEWIGGL
jgi:hypothetical protein